MCSLLALCTRLPLAGVASHVIIFGLQTVKNALAIGSRAEHQVRVLGNQGVDLKFLILSIDISWDDLFDLLILGYHIAPVLWALQAHVLILVHDE